MLGRIVVSILAASGVAAFGADKSSAGVPVQVVVTVAHHAIGAPQTITRSDLSVVEGVEPLPITNFVPLSGKSAELELYVLVDECSNCEFGPKFGELKNFIKSQPDSTAVGIAYIRDGCLKIVEKPTTDRARAIEALSLPAGGKPVNPFAALADLIGDWPSSSARKAVLMVANGIDAAMTSQLHDATAEKALEAAQRSGVIVYAIYHPSADYLSSDFSQIHSGQVHLAHVAYESGGEAYFLSPAPLPSLAPFLTDITDHLANQYLVEFQIKPGESSGLRQIAVKTSFPDMELMSADRVWVPGIEKVEPAGKRREK